MKRSVLRPVLGLTALVLLSACAHTRTVTTGQLPLRRVVVYRNGVGYFERAGRVEQDEVTFKMRQQTIGDFLATLAIVERGGSSVRSASFPVEVEDELQPTPPGPPCPEGAPAEVCFIGWLRQPPAAPPVPKEKNPLRSVVLRLDGAEHDLAVGYVAETPLWRPSYRVVIGDGGTAELQAWGIVQNLSGEDWADVELVLVAGAPLAFQSTLGEPVTPVRPVVTDSGEVISAVPEAVTSLEQRGEDKVDRYEPEAQAGAAEAAAPPPEADVDVREQTKEGLPARPKSTLAFRAAKKPAAAGAGAGAAAGRPYAVPTTPAPVVPPSQAPSPPRDVGSLAAVMTGGGTTRYVIPYPVTVPDESATMVLLASQSVPGESVFLFAPDPGVVDSMGHPFRVARFKNASRGLLERGPIAVFERGSFLGQGMLEPLPAGGTATVPFALERGVGIQSDVRYDQRGARLFKIEAGELDIERDEVTRTTYTIHNGTDESAKVLVRHPRRPGTRLYHPPAGTEDNTGTGAALVPMETRAHAKAELVVDERQPTQQSVDWLSPLATDAVTAYLADSRADQSMVPKLRAAWQGREAWRKLDDERVTLEAEKNKLEEHTAQLRQSLEAIRKNAQAADLRAKLTRKLDATMARLDQIAKRLVELTLALREQEIRFRDAILEIKVTNVPPPKD
jgi:hypothetical protein